jgi:glycosyltransferase involved in cell wall biosynthesis
MEKKRKILMVCEAFGGGVFSYVSQLCNDLSNVYEIYLAYSIRRQTPANYRDLLSKKVKLIEIPNFGNLKKTFKTIHILRKIEKSIQPDIIHLHSSIAGGIGRLAFKGKKNTIIYTPHGYNYLMVGEKTVKGKYYKALEKILGRRNCITLTCCPSEEEEAKKLCKRAFCIETGVNLNELSKIALSLPPKEKNKRFKVFTLGRICFQKQPALFNKIALMTPEADFIWIGDGELKNELTAPNVTVLGWMPRFDALRVASQADAFILCSLGEAIAMSLIENMYFKVLCLVSNTVGNKDVIVDKVNGFVCNSAYEYSQDIKSAINCFPQEYVDRSYDLILKKYNTEVMKTKYISFYNGILSGEIK